MDIYAQNIMDHYKNPRNSGVLEGATVHHAEANYSCGDQISLDLNIENDIVQDIKFQGGGCAISMAAISIISEYIKGKSVDDIMKLTEEDIHKHLGVPIGDRRKKCAGLNLLTIKNAILKYKGLDPLKWMDVVD